MSFGDYIQVSKVRLDNKLGTTLSFTQDDMEIGSYTNENICHAYIYALFFLFVPISG